MKESKRSLLLIAWSVWAGLRMVSLARERGCRVQFWVQNIANRSLHTPALFEALNSLKWLQWAPREGNLIFFLSWIREKKGFLQINYLSMNRSALAVEPS